MAGRIEGGIRVYARIRPMIAREQTSGYARVVFADGDDSVVIEDAKYRARCAVTRTLTPGSTQADAWHCVGDVIPLVLSGFNATILAYGHTSSGKTFTLFGNDTVGYDHLFAPSGDIFLQDDSSGAVNPDKTANGAEYGHVAQAAALAMHPEAGLIPRALAAVFAAVGASGTTDTHEEGDPGHRAETGSDCMRVFVSAMQIYNEDAFDLLDAEPSALEVRWSPDEGVFAAGLQEFEVESAAEALGVVAAAARARVVRETEYNVQSSRSHTIIQVTVERERHGDVALGSGGGGGGTTRSKLNLVDLAGSERWDVHAASGWEDARVSELTSINSSLFVLTRVIAALSEAADAAAGGAAGSRSPRGASSGDDTTTDLVSGVHIPYRESVLTRLLQDSLGGNAVTCIFCTLTPSRDAVSESLNTLIFADAARRVMTRARVNDSALPDAVVIRKLREEVLKLRQETLELKESASAGEGAGNRGSTVTTLALPKAVEGMAVALRQVAAIVASFEEEVIELGARAELEHVTGSGAGVVPVTIPEEAVETDTQEDWDSLDEGVAASSSSAAAAAAGTAVAGTVAGVLTDSMSGAGGIAAGALTERALVFCAALSAVTAEALQPHSLRRAYAAATAVTEGQAEHTLQARPSHDSEGTSVDEMKQLNAASGGGTGSTGNENVSQGVAGDIVVTTGMVAGVAGVRPSTTGEASSSSSSSSAAAAAAAAAPADAVGGSSYARGSLSARGSNSGSKPAWASSSTDESGVAGLTDMIVLDPSAARTRLPHLRAASGGGHHGDVSRQAESASLALPRVRLRDKRGRVVDVAEREASVRAAEEKRTAAEMKELEKRMETNRKLQEWTQKKVQREKEAAAAMKQAEEAMKKEAKRAEAKRLRRARRLKKQLIKQQRQQQKSTKPKSGTDRYGTDWDEDEDEEDERGANTSVAGSIASAPHNRVSKASQSPSKASRSPRLGAGAGRSPRRPPSSPVGSARGLSASGAMSVRSPRLPVGNSRPSVSPRRTLPATALDDAELERDVKAFLAAAPKADASRHTEKKKKQKKPKTSVMKSKQPKKPVSGGTASSGGDGRGRSRGTGGSTSSTSARRRDHSPRHNNTTGGGMPSTSDRSESSAAGDYGVTAAGGGGWDALEDASSPWGHGDADSDVHDHHGHRSARTTAGGGGRTDSHTVSRALMEETNAAIAAADAAAEEAAWALAALNAPGLAGGVQAISDGPGREEEDDTDYRYGGSRLGQRAEIGAVSAASSAPRGSAGQTVPPLPIGESFSRPEAGTAPPSRREDLDSDAMAVSLHAGADSRRQRATSVIDSHLVASVDVHAPGRASSPMAHRPQQVTSPADALQPQRPRVQFLGEDTALEEVLAAQGLRRQHGDEGKYTIGQESLPKIHAPASSGVGSGGTSPRRGAGGVDAVSGAGGGHRVVVRRVHQPVVVSTDLSAGDTVIQASPSGSDLPAANQQQRQWAYDAASAPFSSRFGTQ